MRLAVDSSDDCVWRFDPSVVEFRIDTHRVRVCAYRDTAHFYYPLYAWTSRCWSHGEIPLWNPQDNIGTPVAAEATSAVFYPGQLIFALPWAPTL